eukprot:TRINITY_DN21091_c0_g1_i1.p1 TRINITY_DN21091_c0_g1~~TRINITY_DN21091_c0_g1_i1.p1  ORF type:complete len:612 (+),score=100.90 TRINITY_DN21091_c0_g1_i1:72-1838(+)
MAEVSGSMLCTALVKMEGRLLRQMKQGPTPYSALGTVKSLLVMTFYGTISAVLLPVIFLGLIFVGLFAGEKRQEYVPAGVVLSVLGLLYAPLLALLYVMHEYLGIVASQFFLSLASSLLCGLTASYVQRKFSGEGGLSNLMLRIIHGLKYTVMPVLTLFFLVPLPPMQALGFTVAVIVPMKVLRLLLLCLVRPAHPEPQGDEQLSVMISGDSFPPKLDGVQIFIRNTILALVQDGAKVHVFCSNGGPDIEGVPEKLGATVTRGPGLEVLPCHKLTFPSPWFLLALMKSKPHVVHCFDLAPSIIFLGPILWWLGVPAVLSHHSRIDLYAAYVPSIIGDWGFDVIRGICDIVFNFFEGHLLIDGSQQAQSWFDGHDNTRYWSTGCDLELFHPRKYDAAVRKKFSNGRPDLPLVLFVGRMSPEKQVHRLIELVKTVNPPGQPEICRFCLIGPGEAWQDIYNEIGDREDVVMPGTVKGEDLSKAYASADIFFSPTVTGTLDLVFIEAQASGCTVVGPRAVAVPYVVTDGENGKLYKPLDMKDAARCLREAIRDLKKLKAAARPRAEANFHWKKVTSEAIQFYKHTVRKCALR